MVEPVNMPKLGLQMTSGVITEWLVKEGDTVRKGEPIFIIETDKIVSEVESTVSGTLLKIVVQAGDEAKIMEPCCYVGDADRKIPEGILTEVVAKPVGTTMSPPEKAEPVQHAETDRLFVTPAARVAARELGVDAAVVNGSGPTGRIQKGDVLAYADSMRVKITPVAKKMAAEYGIDCASLKGTGPNGRIQKCDVLAAYESLRMIAPSAADKNVEVEALTDDDSFLKPIDSMRRTVAKRLTESKQTIPHIYFDVDVDASSMISARGMFVDASIKKNGNKLTYNDMILKAAATAIMEFPECNCRFEGDSIRYFRHVNLGVAVSMPNGLMVPVIRKADEMSMAEISKAANMLALKAKSRKIMPDDLLGGVFTVSNIGNSGVDAFHAIINPPETGILAVSSIVEKAVVIDHQLAVRPMMHLSGSFDHRLIDGAVAAKFMVRIKQLLENAPALFF